MDVIAIARRAETADGVAPMDEATLLTLRHHPEQTVTWGDERGFGLLIGDELTLVVAPEYRGSGLGSRLLEQRPAGQGPVTAWSHGDHPAAAALAARHGFAKTRELWVMRRPATDLPELPATPDGIEVRGFRPGDEAEVVRVNAEAFASHPEQGAMDAANLRERMAESWFDPAGLLEAWETETAELLGFHWTKRHGDTEGEVYVVGIAAAAQGRGLGKLLTVAGLHHLAGASGDRPGVASIHLYVDADNEPAVRLYAGLGFTRARTDTHVQYTLPPNSDPTR